MAWLKGSSAQFQIWPVKHVTFIGLKGLADTGTEFGLEDYSFYSCTLIAGREKNEQFLAECESVGETPGANYGFVMVSSDRHEAHITLTVPEAEFDSLYRDLLNMQPAEIEIEFAITHLFSRTSKVLRGLVSSDFRMRMKKADQK